MENLAQYWWVPLTWGYYTVFAWTSAQNNLLGGRWLWVNFAVGALCPLWILVARQSKNLIFDGMIYDNILLFSFLFTTWYLGFGAGFTWINWVGVLLVFLGFFLVRM